MVMRQLTLLEDTQEDLAGAVHAVAGLAEMLKEGRAEWKEEAARSTPLLLRVLARHPQDKEMGRIVLCVLVVVADLVRDAAMRLEIAAACQGTESERE